MKKTIPILTVILLTLCFSFSAHAILLSSEYSVAVGTTQLGVDTYRFDYQVTVNENTGKNIWSNGGWYGYWQGLGGFHIQIPDSAIVLNNINPQPYINAGSSSWSGQTVAVTSSSFWGLGGSVGNAPENPLQSDYQWFQWWGGGWGSIYPNGNTVNFSIDLANVALGTVGTTLTTFWGFDPDDNRAGVDTWNHTNGTYYTMYSTELTGAVAINQPVPEPATMLLFGTGLVGLVGSRLRKKKK